MLRKEHKREAERLLGVAEVQMKTLQNVQPGDDYRSIEITFHTIQSAAALAQVHATLATMEPRTSFITD